MKRVALSIFFLLILTQFVFGKEVRTRFGFFIDLPNNFIQLNANLDDLLKESKEFEERMNDEYFNELVSGLSKTDMNIEYLFPERKYNPEFNNINISMTKQDLREISAFSIDELCPEFKAMVEGLFNKRARLYQCFKDPNNIQKKSSPTVYYFETDGPFKNTRMHQIMLQTQKGYSTVFTLGCEAQNCQNLLRDYISIVNSRS